MTDQFCNMKLIIMQSKIPELISKRKIFFIADDINLCNFISELRYILGN